MLRDGKGLKCWDCDGTCSIDDKDCATCEGQGRLYGCALQVEGGDLRDLQETVMFVRQSRDRLLTPNEWLSLPALYGEAYRYLIPHLCDFEDRLECLAQE